MCNVFPFINLIEKQVSNHLEGVPYYGPRSDFSGTEISNRLVGNKRSNSDSSFMGSSRDAFQMVPDSFQNSHFMKVILNYHHLIINYSPPITKKRKILLFFVFFSLMSKSCFRTGPP
jgi:hypothetical protein